MPPRISSPVPATTICALPRRKEAPARTLRPLPGQKPTRARRAAEGATRTHEQEQEPASDSGEPEVDNDPSGSDHAAEDDADSGSEYAEDDGEIEIDELDDESDDDVDYRPPKRLTRGTRSSTARRSVKGRSSRPKARGGPKARTPCRFPGCRTTFSRLGDMVRHLQTCHSDSGLTPGKKEEDICMVCHKTFSRRDALLRHFRLSTEECREAAALAAGLPEANTEAEEDADAPAQKRRRHGD